MKAKEMNTDNIVSLMSPRQGMTPPATETAKRIFNETGPGLQFVTRSDGDMMRAYETCLNYSILFGEDYTLELIESIMRLGAAHNGQRTRDAIDLVQAGGPLPGEAYNGTGNQRNGEASALRFTDAED